MVDIAVALAEDGADPSRLAELTQHLGSELRQLDVGDVRPGPSRPAPPGTRGLDVTAVGAVVVAMIGAGGLPAVIDAVRAWLARGQQAPRSIRLEIDGDILELSGAKPEEQDRLVSLFLGRHPEKGPSWTADARP